MFKEDVRLNKFSHIATIVVSVFLFLAIPATVVVTLKSDQATKPTKAATAFEDTLCATTLDPIGRSQCGNGPGVNQDYYFCDRWQGGYCDDFRNLQTSVDTDFPTPNLSQTCCEQMNEKYTLDCTGPSAERYSASMRDGMIPQPCGFSKFEHFMVKFEDSTFGTSELRLKQPIDLTARTGHIHFDVDLKTAARRYLRMTLSPEISKRGTDDRGGGIPAYPANAFDVWMQGGPDTAYNFIGHKQTNGQVSCKFCFSSSFDAGVTGKHAYDNVRNSVDVYLSRTHIKITVDNQTMTDQAIPDIGFDKAYIYFGQASYNPCKDNSSGTFQEIYPTGTLDQCSMAANMFHWDNLAFDGPVLPKNGLTPSGSEDVAFNAFSVGTCGNWESCYVPGKTGDCKVKGVAAVPNGLADWNAWVTWVARLPANTAVTSSDITCSPTNWNPAAGVSRIQAVEIIQPNSSTTPPPSDTTKPTVSITGPANGVTVNGSVNITATAADNVGVTRVDFYVDGVLKGSSGVSPYVYAWDTSMVVNGTHTLLAKAYDAGNNEGVSASVTVTTNNSNSSISVLQITSPAANSTVSGTINIAAQNINNSQVSTVAFLIDDVQIGTDSTSPYSFSWDSKTKANGSHKISVRPTNISGPDAIVTVNVQNQAADTSAPTVNFTSPLNGATVSGNVNVTADATDNVSVAKVEFYVNGVLSNTDTASPYGFTWTTPAANGNATLVALATDPTGNKSSATITVLVQNGDTQAPSAPTNLQASAASATSVNLSWTASTDNTGVAKYWVVRNNVTITSVTTTSYTDNSVSASTNYTYQIIASDAAGNNSSPSNSASVTTPAPPDTQAPSVPTNLTGSAQSSSQINLGWTASSDNVAVTAYDVYRNNSKVTSVSTTSFGDTGLIPDTEYNYFVKARDAAGNTSVATGTLLVKTLPVPSGLGNINGKVSSSQGGGVDSAKITTTIGGYRVIYMTSSTGDYLMSNLSPSTYSLKYTKKGFVSLTQSAQVVANTTVTKNVTLTKR